MLSAQEISVVIGQQPLLQQISLNVHPGELVVVIGPNGAGKSTLLKALSGELSPQTGNIQLNGKNLAQWSVKELARMRSVLPQQASLAFPFKVKDVVLMGRSPHADKGQTGLNQEICQQAMVFTDTLALQHRRYTTLSGGERQRVHFARVLAQIWHTMQGPARYLLLDEPTSALDLAQQHKLLQLAQRVAKTQGVGVLAILHDLNLAARYADRVAVMQQGQLLTIDTPARALSAERIEHVFGCPVIISWHPQQANCPVILASL